MEPAKASTQSREVLPVDSQKPKSLPSQLSADKTGLSSVSEATKPILSLCLKSKISGQFCEDKKCFDCGVARSKARVISKNYGKATLYENRRLVEDPLAECPNASHVGQLCDLADCFDCDCLREYRLKQNPNPWIGCKRACSDAEHPGYHGVRLMTGIKNGYIEWRET